MRVPSVVFAALLAPGCIQAAVSAGQPTAMERQLLGAYEALDEDLALASSVRAGPGLARAPQASLRQLALRARALQRFNEDDLLELKAGGCLLETLAARIAPRECNLVREDAAVQRRRSRVIEEENRARGVLVRWAAHEVARGDGRAAPSPEELAEVRAAYGKLVRETAAPGHLVEVAPGDVRAVER